MQIVGVKFKPVGEIYDFNVKGLNLKKGDGVIVDTVNGLYYGVVAVETVEKEPQNEVRKVLRKVTEKDLAQIKQNKEKAKKVVAETKKLASKLGLSMKLVDAEYSFDTAKLSITYTAEDRVDFRELVKQLASIYKTRIELRQIGARDEAKHLGGLGPCGRPLCCANHLRELGKVSLKMAKNQGLSLNPTGISGTCGRLMCCLAYEDSDYAKALSQMPKLNSKVQTPDGEGIDVYNNILKNQVSVKFVGEDGTYKIVDYALGEIKFGNGNDREKRNWTFWRWKAWWPFVWWIKNNSKQKTLLFF